MSADWWLISGTNKNPFVWALCPYEPKIIVKLTVVP